MHRTIRMAAALGLVLGFVPWIAPAVAQGPGGGRGAGGGPGGGRGGGMPGFGMFGGGQFTSPTSVVNTPEVQKELDLTDKQITAIKDLQDKANTKRRDIFQQFMPNFGRGQGRPGGPGAGFGGGPGGGGPNGGPTAGRGFGAQGPAQAAGGQTANGGGQAGAGGGRQPGAQPTNGGFGGGQGGAPGGPAGFGGGQGGGRGNRGGGQGGPGGGGPGGGFGGGPGGGGQGGPGGGGPGGGFGGGPGGGGPGGPGGPGGQGGPGGRGRPQLTPEQQASFQAMGDAMSTFQKQYEASLMKILDPKQRKRLMEIVYQMDGPRVMTRPEIVTKLNLQEDQQEHVQSVLQEMQVAQRQIMTASRNNGPQFLDANGRPDRQKMRDYMQSKEGQAQREKDQKAREKLNDLALATMTKILSNSQRNTFKKLIGTKFDVRSITFNRRGPGGPNQANANGTRTQPGGNRAAANANDDDPDEDKPAAKAATPAPAAKATKNARKSLRAARGLGDDA